MLYELSNVIFNKKLKNVKVNHPFTKKKNSIPAFRHDGRPCFFIISDKPKNLFKAFNLGLSIKPMAFTKDTLEHSSVNTIILDFDNLTEVQYNFIRSIVNGQYTFVDEMYGGDSVGRKTWLKDSEGIPNATPEKWKFKVFFPCEHGTICTWKSIKKQFIDAVAFFNPIFGLDEVEDVFELWLKANNRKDKIDNPKFNGWILPDVAMLNSFRTQVTYGCDTSLSKTTFVPYEDWYRENGLFIVKTTSRASSKDDYSGLEWKDDELSNDLVEEIYVDAKTATKEKEEIESVFAKKVMLVEYDWLKQPTFHYPLCKSDFAHRLMRSKFDDLVIPTFNPNSLVFSMMKKTVDLTIDDNQFVLDMRLYSKTMTRLASEFKWQGGKIDKVKLIEDIIHLFQIKHGIKVFHTISNDLLDKLSHELSSTMYKCLLTHNQWRLTHKLRETTSSQEVNELLVQYTKTKDKALLNKYLGEREKDVHRRIKEGETIKNNYEYHRKGIKRDTINEAISTHAPIHNVDEWVEWCSLHMDDFNDFKTEQIEKWFYDFSKQSGLKLNNDRNTGKGKWSELFKDKSKVEIEDIIETSDISKQLKYKLKKRYLW